MPLTLDDPETERLARELAERTGETVQVATRRALEDRLRTVPGRRPGHGPLPDAESRRQIMEELRLRVARMPERDARSADEIIGYDENGIPR